MHMLVSYINFLRVLYLLSVYPSALYQLTLPALEDRFNSFNTLCQLMLYLYQVTFYIIHYDSSWYQLSRVSYLLLVSLMICTNRLYVTNFCISLLTDCAKCNPGLLLIMIYMEWKLNRSLLFVLEQRKFWLVETFELLYITLLKFGHLKLHHPFKTKTPRNHTTIWKSISKNLITVLKLAPGIVLYKSTLLK